VIQEVADELPPNVVLITAGRISWEEIETAVSLFMFNEAQTITFLQRVSDITTNDAQEIHNQLGGHPLYLGLFAEVNNNQDLVDIPEFKIQQEIKNRYFKFLEPDERRFLLSTASLEELNRDICTSVASRTHGFDRVKVDQILSSLKNRTVVQTLDTNSDGLQVFKIHDVFRDFLQTRSDHNDIAQVGACVYHAEKLIDLVGDNRAFETEINHVTSWAAHLSRRSIYEETNIHTNLIKATIADDGLRFYPLLCWLTSLKSVTRQRYQTPSSRQYYQAFDESRNIANHFMMRILTALGQSTFTSKANLQIQRTT